MASGRKVKYLTPDEILATMSRSAFPSIVTEGDDDVIVWRRLEANFIDQGLTLIPAGGRDAVLEVYRRRNELSPRAIVMFIADQDTWVLRGIPSEYVGNNILFTHGYSVENDMFIDGSLHSLLVGSECSRFEIELENVIEWYALACSRVINGVKSPLDVHPNEILDNKIRCEILMELTSSEEYPDNLRNYIGTEPFRFLRGKTLLALLIRQSNGYSYRVLLNIGASRNGPLFQRIESLIRDYLSLAIGAY